VHICPTDHRPLVRISILHYIIGTAVKYYLCGYAAAVSEISYYFIVDARNLKLLKVDGDGSTQWVLYIVKDTILLKKYVIK